MQPRVTCVEDERSLIRLDNAQRRTLISQEPDKRKRRSTLEYKFEALVKGY